jgi:hypothetical protein
MAPRAAVMGVGISGLASAWRPAGLGPGGCLLARYHRALETPFPAAAGGEG